MWASLHIISLSSLEIGVKAERFKGRLKWTNRHLTPWIEINPACIIEFEQPKGLRRLARAFHLHHVFNTELFNFDSNRSQRFTLCWKIHKKKVSAEFRINRETMPILVDYSKSLRSLIQGIFFKIQLFCFRYPDMNLVWNLSISVCWKKKEQISPESRYRVRN